jgi:hypothetical protein
MCFAEVSGGKKIYFSSQSNNIQDNYYFELPFEFVSNVWCQLTLTYTATNVAFYTNGILAATSYGLSVSDPSGWYGNDVGAGMYYYPPEAIRSAGFKVGAIYFSPYPPQLTGEFDELQTYNYALTAQQVAQGFPGFNGAANLMQDSDYDGRSDLLEIYADGTDPNNPTNVVPVRLGYWRFNDSTNAGEMGQFPILALDVTNTPDWSRKSLVISSASDSQLTYRDVETSGWANFNAQKGAVRFWFKPDWTTAPAPGSFLYLGNPTNASTGEWNFQYNSGYFKLITASNGLSATLLTSGYCPLSSSNWYQIVLNYSATNTALFVNGSNLCNGSGVTNYPRLSDRTNGLVVGNVTGGGAPVNGQFDELETFNYNLDTNEITRSFQAVNSVDSDLNGVADLLEDLILTNNVPFMGVPFPVTGVFEAEQFDVGGPNVGYYTLDSANATTNYRVSQLDITNCDDLGGGFCVDKLRAGEWLQYTMDVGVAQTYAVEARVEGIGTNGAFKIEFFTNGVMYAWTTNNLAVSDTNWVNVTFKHLWLAAGTNVMKVTMLTNGLVGGVSSGYVMKFNYTSIYPSWNEGVPNIVTNITVVPLYSNRCDWATANSNAVSIQNTIDQLNTLNPDQGGVVSIPAGTYYVASLQVTDETSDFTHNTADFIYSNNVVIQGAGKTNTVLIAQNRAVTIFNVGWKFNGVGIPATPVPVTNFTLQNLTLEGSPHWVYDATSANQRTWEDGGFRPGHMIGTNFVSGFPVGCLLFGLGLNASQSLNNVLVANCLFKNSPNNDIVSNGNLTDFLSISNDFLFRVDGTNGGYTGIITKQSLTTTNWPVWGLGIYVQAEGAVNLNLIACNFNGHVNPTNTDPSWLADGILWCQAAYLIPAGNWFAARNTITNYGFEAIQWNSGPAAAVQNRFSTYASTTSTCALDNPVPWYATGPSGQANDLSFAFVGNTVVGGEQGVLGGTDMNIADLLVSGNTFNLYLTDNNASWDWPGAAVYDGWVDKLDVSGNSLIGGEQGIAVQYEITNVVMIGNDFTAANLRSVDMENSGQNPVGVIQNAQLIKNKLAGGESFQLRAPLQDGTHYFLLQNTYVTTNGTPAGLVTEPQSLPVHYQP